MTKLLSLPVLERLTSLRLQGHREVPTDTAVSAWNHLERLGLDLGELVSGRLGARSFSGQPFRWGQGWFFEIRDGGLSWNFDRHDALAISSRVGLLIKMYVRMRGQPVLALLNRTQEAVADAVVGPDLSILDA